MLKTGLLAVAIAVSIECLLPSGASAQLVQNGRITSYTPAASAVGASRLDFSNARPMRQPQLNQLPVPSAVAPTFQGPPGFSPGGTGTGKQTSLQLAPAKTEATMRSDAGSPPVIAPQEYGLTPGGTPYTTSRVNAYNQPTATFQPYAATGKLFFNVGSATFVCTASLIKPGILVTAAHCIADYGTNTLFTNWVWVPGYNNGTAPYGSWSAKSVHVLTSWLNGTDGCSSAVCPNDIAVINLLTPSGLPGATVGWYGYGWNGYGFNTLNQTLVNQLGYPSALDGGVFMQRTDSQGVVSAAQANNTIWGSLQTGGSSGGPLLINFGRPPILSNGVGFGVSAEHNVVIGVTSCGYVNQSSTSPKLQGASPFTSNNIVALVNFVCSANPGKC